MTRHRATQSFVYGSATGERFMHGGTVVDGSDPVVRDFPDLFVIAEAEPEKPTQPTRRRRNG